MTMTNKLSRDQAAIVGAYTGKLAGPFSDLHEYVERVLGRPVYTHEFADEELYKEIREKCKQDFLNICAEK
jgi:hypothetical protein